MHHIMVTIENEQRTIQKDVEMPAHVRLALLRPELLGLMKVNVLNTNAKFYSVRLKRVLNDEETLGQAGIWNGDYLVLIEHG